jgi:hypothetical protein
MSFSRFIDFRAVKPHMTVMGRASGIPLLHYRSRYDVREGNALPNAVVASL